MQRQFSLGKPIYYVSKSHPSHSGYIPVTRVHSALNPLLLTLGNEIVISPMVRKNGNIAYDNLASYWVSKEAFESHQAHAAQPIWQRLSHWLGFWAGGTAKGKPSLLPCEAFTTEGWDMELTEAQ